MMNKSELAEIVITLKRNVDEAEQFSDYIDDIIRHCDKSFLLYLIDSLAHSVEFNLETHTSFKENIVDNIDELRDLIAFVREKL